MYINGGTWTSVSRAPFTNTRESVCLTNHNAFVRVRPVHCTFFFRIRYASAAMYHTYTNTCVYTYTYN